MIKTLASSALALAMVSTPALAQSVAPDWSGPYIGIFGGYNQSNDDGDENLGFDRNLDGRYGDQVTTTPVAPATVGINAFTPGFCGGMATSTVPTTGCRDDNDGVEAGVRAGYDMQFGNFVVGALAEYSVNNVQDSVTGFSTTPAFYTFTRELESTAAARLKLGYAYGPALIYGTGGYASWGEVDPADAPRFDRAPAPPTRHRPDMPAWLEAAIMRAVAVDPNERFEDVEELIHVLETGSAVAAPPPRQLSLIERDPVRFWQGVSLVLLIVFLVSMATR